MKKKVIAGSVLAAIGLLVPVTAHAQQNFTLTEKPLFRQDENQNRFYYTTEDQFITGKFSIMPSYPAGDLYPDGKINAQDAAAVLLAAAQSGASNESPGEILLAMFPELGTAEQAALYADIDYDDRIDAQDAARILTYAAQLGTGDSQYPIGYASYYADEAGILQSGWITDVETGSRYYAEENYQLRTGWLTQDDITYYLDADAGAVTGLQQIAGNTYYFDEAGVMQKGWQMLKDQQYYFEPDGKMHTGLLNLEDQIYYFNPDGILISGWQEIDGHTYYFNPDGTAYTGWLAIDGNQYYFEPDGRMYTGLLNLEDQIYYFNPDGILTSGWQEIDRYTYYFNPDGTAYTGWLTADGNQYYFDPDGRMHTGWVQDQGNYYYLDETGILLKRQWLFLEDNKTYYLGIKGDALTGWQTLTGYTYYFKQDGEMSVGWQEIDGKEYYFYPENGTMAKNTVIDEKTIGADGVAKAPGAVSEKLLLNRERAQTALQQNGSTVSAIFSYMRATNRYKYIESTRTLAQIEANGWLYYVDYAFTHYYGVCYYLTAKMDFLLQEAGYECRIVHATHGSGDHYWNQVKINGTWVNYDCTNGYNAYDWNRMMNAGNYIFLGYVYPVYE
ncbi:MAG: hypothetical protein K2J71_10270 [Oscillospiraceae bacterium]|nr:hypothetical protein [Oscillospiraceae bacterium]